MLIMIHKKGPRDLAENYRGISIERTMEKIFSLVWMARLMPWFEKSGLLNGAQFGFRPECSTTDAIFIVEGLLERTRTAKTKTRCLPSSSFSRKPSTPCRAIGCG